MSSAPIDPPERVCGFDSSYCPTVARCTDLRTCQREEDAPLNQQCTHCPGDPVFDTKQGYAAHMRMHAERVECPVDGCKRKCQFPGGLTKHLRQKHGIVKGQAISPVTVTHRKPSPAGLEALKEVRDEMAAERARLDRMIADAERVIAGG